MRLKQIFFKAALAIAASYFTVLDTPTIARDQIPMTSAAMNSGKLQSAPTLFSSHQTRASLGKIADYIPKWAGMDVLIITRQDLESHGYISTDKSKKNKKLIQKEAFEEFSKTISEFPLSRFQREKLLDRYLNHICGNVPSAFPLPARNKNEQPVCAIVLPDLEFSTKRSLISKISGISEQPISTIPGSRDEWLLMIIAHEIAHASHDITKARTQKIYGWNYERLADQYSLDIYMQDAKNILDTTIGNPLLVPETFIALRGIRALDSRHNAMHASSAALSLPGVYKADIKDIEDAKLYINARKLVLNAIWNEASGNDASRHIPAKYWSPFYKRYQSAKMLLEDGFFDKAPIEKRYVENFLEGAQYYPKTFRIQPN